MKFQSYIKAVGGNEGEKCKYRLRLDTYGCGCFHNCQYCYARSLLEFRGLWRPNNPSVVDIEQVHKTIRKIPSGMVVRLGGMTDCFQPIERGYRITWRAIEYLNKRKIHYLIVTKSDMVTEYMDILDKDLAHIQISVTSTDDEISKQIEEGAPLPQERIRAIETLQANGFDVAIRLSPYIPNFVNTEVINNIKCDKLQVEFLRINGQIKKTFKDVDFSEYTHKEGSYSHLPLERKIELLKAFHGKQVSVCEDVTEHYNYWKENVNYNKDDCCNLRL